MEKTKLLLFMIKDTIKTYIKHNPQVKKEKKTHQIFPSYMSLYLDLTFLFISIKNTNANTTTYTQVVSLAKLQENCTDANTKRAKLIPKIHNHNQPSYLTC